MMLDLIFKRKKITFAENSNGLTCRAKCMQISTMILVTLSVIPAGMCLGYPAIASQWMIADGPLDVNEVSWFSSITAIACPIGGILSAILCDKVGRKGTLIITDIISISHWILIGVSSRSEKKVLFIELLIARALAGLGVGMCATPANLYAGEICHPDLRGRLSVLTPLMFSVGTLVIFLIENAVDVSGKLRTKKLIISI
jgi:MFS family permease